MSNGNGEIEPSTDIVEGLSTDQKLDLTIEGLADIRTELYELKEVLGEMREWQEELLEKISNMSLPGEAFDLDRFDS